MQGIATSQGYPAMLIWSLMWFIASKLGRTIGCVVPLEDHTVLSGTMKLVLKEEPSGQFQFSGLWVLVLKCTVSSAVETSFSLLGSN